MDIRQAFPRWFTREQARDGQKFCKSEKGGLLLSRTCYTMGMFSCVVLKHWLTLRKRCASSRQTFAKRLLLLKARGQARSQVRNSVLPTTHTFPESTFLRMLRVCETCENISPKKCTTTHVPSNCSSSKRVCRREKEKIHESAKRATKHTLTERLEQ